MYSLFYRQVCRLVGTYRVPQDRTALQLPADMWQVFQSEEPTKLVLAPAGYLACIPSSGQ
jgi:hypothetical protein